MLSIRPYSPLPEREKAFLVIPWLLTNTDSAVVIDPKGENYQITADVRRRMGHKIIRLDPFGVCGPGGDTYNVHDAIDPGTNTALDDVRALAEAIVVKTGRERAVLERCQRDFYRRHDCIHSCFRGRAS